MMAARRKAADGLDTLEIADRLSAVAAELAVLVCTVEGLEFDRRQKSGVSAILWRQIEELDALNAAVDPPQDEAKER